MLKKPLTDAQMSDAAFIDEAVEWSKKLTRMKSRGPGDVDNAMRRIESDYGVDYWTIWQLRYTRHRIKSIGTGAYMRLKYAYEAERQRQRRLLSDDIETTERITGPDHPAVAASKAVVGTNNEEEE